jgi:hypothetical protein
MNALALSLLFAALPPQAPMPPQAPDLPDDTPAAVARCECGSACTCGCQEGGPCTCGDRAKPAARKINVLCHEGEAPEAISMHATMPAMPAPAYHYRPAYQPAYYAPPAVQYQAAPTMRPAFAPVRNFFRGLGGGGRRGGGC